MSQPSLSRQYSPEILPVKLEIMGAGKWQLSYQLPCQSEELGLYLGQGAEDDSFKVGVVVRRFHERCVGIGTIKSTLLSFPVNFELVSFNPSLEAKRYRILSPQLLRHQDVGSAHRSFSEVSLAYTTHCGPFMGLMFGPEKAGEQSVAVIESRDATVKSCSSRSYRLAKMTAPRLSRTMAPFNPPPPHGSDGQAYRLALRPIRGDSFEKLAGEGGRIRLQFHRRCHQAPIGIVTQQNGSQTLIAMLVADYPASICPEGGTQEMWTSYETGIFNEQQLAAIRPAQTSSQNDLELVLARSVETADQKIHFEGLGDLCQNQPAQVFVEDGDDLFFSLLINRRSSNGCKNQITELSLTTSLDPNLRLSSKLQALKLKAF